MVHTRPRSHSQYRTICLISNGSRYYEHDSLHSVAVISRSFCLAEKGSLAHSLYVIDEEMQEQASGSIAASSLPSSSERSSSSALQFKVKEGMESDEEIRRVPEIGGEAAGTSASGRDCGSAAGPDRVQPSGEVQRKRGRNPADKESKRLKRLLRNRVSAQQARERKKAYLNVLETRVKELEKNNSQLEEKLSTLQNENQMLRHILKNTTASRRGGDDTNADGSS